MVVDFVDKSNYVSLHCIFPQLFVRYNKINNDLVAGTKVHFCQPSKKRAPRSTVFPRVDKMHCQPQRGHYLYTIGDLMCCPNMAQH